MPHVAVSGNTVHVIWHEYDYGIVYRRSTNGGTTWQNIDSIIPGMGYNSIQAFGDTIYIAGIVPGDLTFTKSIDGGNTWAPLMYITNASSNPTIRVIQNNVFYLSISYTLAPNAWEVYNVLSFNGGETWLDSQLVSEDDSHHSPNPAMDTDDSGGIHITWYDHKYSPYAWTGDIFYRTSRDSGNSWEEIDSLTVVHRAVWSDIHAEETNLHIVWEDDRHGFDNNFEIYYRMSSDLGQTWGFEVRLTDALYHSYCPSLACGGGYLHLFWQDRRDGVNAPLYYKRKDLTSSVGEAGLSSVLEFDVYPNPFTHTLYIKNIPFAEDTDIKIFDITGKLIKSFSHPTLYSRRPTQISWDGTDSYKKKLPTGVYFVQLQTPHHRETKKVILLK